MFQPTVPWRPSPLTSERVGKCVFLTDFCQMCSVVVGTLYWTSWAWSPCLPGYLPLPQHGHLGFLAVLSWRPAEKPGRPDSGLSPASCPDAWVSAGVRAAALGKAVPALPKGPRALLQPRWFQFEAFTRCWSWIEFLPWNQQDLLQHFAWIKIFVPFFFFFPQGRRRTPEASEGRKLLQGPTEVGHVRQLLIV